MKQQVLIHIFRRGNLSLTVNPAFSVIGCIFSAVTTDSAENGTAKTIM